MATGMQALQANQANKVPLEISTTNLRNTTVSTPPTNALKENEKPIVHQSLKQKGKGKEIPD